MRITRDEMLMSTAIIQAMRSTCGRKRVGAVLAREGRIISTGYAGAPSGAEHCSDACMAAAEGGCQRTVHAEINAIVYAARHGIATEGSELYCTASPCINCAKAIVNAGIISVKYLEPYRITDGLDLLFSLRIPCRQMSAPGFLPL